jgi:hypothetical protein
MKRIKNNLSIIPYKTLENIYEKGKSNLFNYLIDDIIILN